TGPLVVIGPVIRESPVSVPCSLAGPGVDVGRAVGVATGVGVCAPPLDEPGVAELPQALTTTAARAEVARATRRMRRIIAGASAGRFHGPEPLPSLQSRPCRVWSSSSALCGPDSRRCC